jgi:DNA-binding transcriptional MerR regulator
MADPKPRNYDRAVTEIDELRTVGFRLREIQRLLSMRVEQENRRLQEEGIDPVTEPGVGSEEARSGHEQQE